MSARSRIGGFLAGLMFLATPEVYPAVSEVTNTNDSGPGSLRDAAILELRDANGGLQEANDNWIDSPSTAILRGVNNTTGIAVVEVYALQ